MEQNRHFTAVVIGENPSELIKKYDKSLKVEPYIAFKLSDAKKYKEQYISNMKECINKLSDEKLKTALIYDLEVVQEMEDVDYYLRLTDGYELDEETGNVILTENPNGKYDWCRPGKQLCMPMLDKNGDEIFKGRKKDIDWSKIHLHNTYTYEVVWDLVMGNKEPEGEMEKTLYNNMKNRKEYFSFFGDRENYVISNTAFWGYAYLDENGWIELEDNMSQLEWVKNFYDRFIAKLPDNTLISLYECFRK
jgi:hypothetical protein